MERDAGVPREKPAPAANATTALDIMDNWYTVMQVEVL
jgi:hypothetical protein